MVKNHAGKLSVCIATYLPMQTFTIRDLERFSDIRAHTLRTWELRYNIPKPQRNSGNARHYSLNELKEILYISLLNKNGFKISYLSRLSAPEIEARIEQLTGDDNRKLKAVTDLLIHMHTLDAPAFESVLDDCFSSLPVYEVLNGVIRSFLLKTNLFWQGNQLVEEHLVVTIIRKKIILAIERTATCANMEKAVLLFLNGTRQLDIGLLYASYFFKNLGLRVIYLGNDISLGNLEAIFKKHKPDFLYTYLSKRSHFDFNGLISIMNEQLPAAQLVVSHPPATLPLACPSDKIAFMEYEEALQFISMQGNLFAS